MALNESGWDRRSVIVRETVILETLADQPFLAKHIRKSAGEEVYPCAITSWIDIAGSFIDRK